VNDLGAQLHEVQVDGSISTRFRTTPLWGVAHSAPYGHDGNSLDLDSIIRRHGGEAATSQKAYAAANAQQRTELQGFLRALVLE
jgi:CxxC motif-containing protein (DUF1111 family)